MFAASSSVARQRSTDTTLVVFRRKHDWPQVQAADDAAVCGVDANSGSRVAKLTCGRDFDRSAVTTGGELLFGIGAAQRTSEWVVFDQCTLSVRP